MLLQARFDIILLYCYNCNRLPPPYQPDFFFLFICDLCANVEKPLLRFYQTPGGYKWKAIMVLCVFCQLRFSPPRARFQPRVIHLPWLRIADSRCHSACLVKVMPPFFLFRAAALSRPRSSALCDSAARPGICHSSCRLVWLLYRAWLHLVTRSLSGRSADEALRSFFSESRGEIKKGEGEMWVVVEDGGVVGWRGCRNCHHQLQHFSHHEEKFATESALGSDHRLLWLKNISRAFFEEMRRVSLFPQGINS